MTDLAHCPMMTERTPDPRLMAIGTRWGSYVMIDDKWLDQLRVLCPRWGWIFVAFLLCMPLRSEAITKDQCAELIVNLNRMAATLSNNIQITGNARSESSIPDFQPFLAQAQALERARKGYVKAMQDYVTALQNFSQQLSRCTP